MVNLCRRSIDNDECDGYRFEQRLGISVSCHGDQQFRVRGGVYRIVSRDTNYDDDYDDDYDDFYDDDFYDDDFYDDDYDDFYDDYGSATIFWRLRLFGFSITNSYNIDNINIDNIFNDKPTYNDNRRDEYDEHDEYDDDEYDDDEHDEHDDTVDDS